MPAPVCNLLLIGDELTSGRVADTNGSWLAAELASLGIQVTRLEVIRDRLGEIVEALQRAGAGSEIVLVTGGLGPTADDITRDAFAVLLGTELNEHGPSMKKIEDRYRERGIPMNSISRRQALFPRGATIVNNAEGTADSFWCEHSGAFFFTFPGVPHEMRQIFREELKPLLCSKFPTLKVPAESAFRCFGLSESAIGTAIEGCSLDTRLDISYRALFPEVHLKFSSPHLTQEECDRAAQLAQVAIGPEHIISSDLSIGLSRIVLNLLRESGKTVSFAESCTGGLASSLLVAEPGVSDVFMGGAVVYANELKEKFAGVSPKTLSAHGAVSAEVALELAAGIRKATGSSIGVSTTGIAGPGGGTSEKPAGTIFLGYSRAERETAVRFHLPFERNRFRLYGAQLTLDLIRRDLLGLPLQFERR